MDEIKSLEEILNIASENYSKILEHMRKIDGMELYMKISDALLEYSNSMHQAIQFIIMNRK